MNNNTLFIILIGGSTQEGAPLNDLWQYDHTKKEYSQITVFGRNRENEQTYPPSPRWLAASTVFSTISEGPIFIVHGGTDGIRLFDDMYAYYVKDSEWVPIIVVGDSPFARMGHALVSFSVTGAAAASSGGGSNGGKRNKYGTYIMFL